MDTEENRLAYSIVVPLFNEQESVTPLYVKIIDVMDAVGEPYEIVFVDDGSRDGTFRVLSEISNDDARVTVVRLRRNFGQTAALKAGFDHSQAEVIISMDGDLQHDPAEIPLFPLLGAALMLLFGKTLDPQPKSEVAVAPGVEPIFEHGHDRAHTHEHDHDHAHGHDREHGHSHPHSPLKFLIDLICPGMILLSFIF